MAQRLQDRADSIAYLVNSLKALGYHSSQHGPQVVVKAERGDAYGFEILFGARKTYLNDFIAVIAVLPSDVKELLAIFTSASSASLPELVRQLQVEFEACNNMSDVLNDVDLLRRLFLPEVSLDHLALACGGRGIPFLRKECGLLILSRSIPEMELGYVFLQENLWYFSLAGCTEMRVADEDLVDLVFELEDIRSRCGAGAYDVLLDCYGT